MRIMLDTNVLLSAVIFRSKMMWNMMARIMEDHRLVLSSYVIDECYEVVERKKPSLIPALDRLFESIALAPKMRTSEKCGKIRPTQKEAAKDGTQE